MSAAIDAPRPAAIDRWHAPLARVLRRNEAKIGAAIVAAFLLLTIAAPLVAPYDPYDQDLSNALSPPSAPHLFGADQYGRDVFSRVLYGTRTALLAIVVADGLALGLGSALGLDRRIPRRLGGRRGDAVRRRAARLPVPVAGAHHRRGAGPQPDQFDDRHRHRLHAAICAPHPRPGAVGAGRRLCARGARHRHLAHPHHAAPRAAEQLRPGHRHGDLAGGLRHRRDGGAVLPRARRAAALARLGRAPRRRPQLFSHRLVDRHLPGARHFRRGARLQPRRRRAARPVRPRRRV